MTKEIQLLDHTESLETSSKGFTQRILPNIFKALTSNEAQQILKIAKEAYPSGKVEMTLKFPAEALARIGKDYERVGGVIRDAKTKKVVCWGKEAGANVGAKAAKGATAVLGIVEQVLVDQKLNQIISLTQELSEYNQAELYAKVQLAGEYLQSAENTQDEPEKYLDQALQYIREFKHHRLQMYEKQSAKLQKLVDAYNKEVLWHDKASDIEGSMQALLAISREIQQSLKTEAWIFSLLGETGNHELSLANLEKHMAESVILLDAKVTQLESKLFYETATKIVKDFADKATKAGREGLNRMKAQLKSSSLESELTDYIEHREANAQDYVLTKEECSEFNKKLHGMVSAQFELLVAQA